MTPTVPVTGSTATVGMNWERLPSEKLSWTESSLTLTAALAENPIEERLSIEAR